EAAPQPFDVFPDIGVEQVGRHHPAIRERVAAVVVPALGGQRGEASGAASSLILGTAITAPFVGLLIDRIGTRRVALASLAG
ncbi:hypothetical protein, partial [Salmonella enterica]|uniref:hypothetical protein n=1 Tax=Salmonella enterica TaxID=28901 RepID=UPI0032967D23